MHRLIVSAILSIASCLAFASTHTPFEPETLNYKVMFKWGLINKKAGHATLSLTHDRKHYTAHRRHK